MTKRSFAQRLYKLNQKILKWTLRADDALTRKDALKALKKIKKHSLKLARLQGTRYTEDIQEENS